jgi:hypothetical protein
LPSWSHLLIDTITYALRTGVDGNGDPTFGSQLTCLGRFEKDSKIERTQQSQWVSADLLATEVELPKGTHVWPPGYATGDSNAALTVKRCKAATSPLTGDTLYESVL